MARLIQPAIRKATTSVRTDRMHRAAGWNVARVTVHWKDFCAFAEEVKLPKTYALLKVCCYQQWLAERGPNSFRSL